MHAMPLAAVVAALALPAAAWSDDAGPHAGQWTGTMTTQAGGRIQVDLVLKGDGGSWRMASPPGTAGGRVNPCLDRDLPVSVVAQSKGSLQFDVHGGSQTKGCIEQRATLTAGEDGRTLEGRLADGRVLAFTRR